MNEYYTYQSCNILFSKYTLYDSLINRFSETEIKFIEALSDFNNALVISFDLFQNLSMNKETLAMLNKINDIRKKGISTIKKHNKNLSTLSLEHENFYSANLKENNRFVTIILPYFFDNTELTNENNYTLDIDQYMYIYSTSKENTKILKTIIKEIKNFDKKTKQTTTN